MRYYLLMNLNKYQVSGLGAALGLALLAAPLPLAAASITVQADRPGHPVASTLWGIFFEDINLSADGGLYPELVRNRSFEDSEKQADHWKLTSSGDGRSEVSIDSSRPLTPFNRRSLRVRVAGPATLVNEGYWGMNVVQGEAYQVRLAARAADGFKGPLSVRLEHNQAGQELAKGEITDLTGQWKYYTLELTAAGTDPKARLSLGFSGSGTLWLDMVSVLPKKTWKGHGLRPDLCEMLAALKPAFVRFPGGCWVEGDDMAHMYNWKDTVGDIGNRKPLWNIWQYWATHGLGYHEYLQLCEDLGAEPMFCINVGMSHREVVPLDKMGPWLQDALDALEYANGPVDSLWGGLRAKNGHPAPFNMKYLEIGNENGGPAYHERWELFHQVIKAKYPQVQLIANVWGGYPTRVRPEIIDEHYYNNPDFFIQQAHKYDTYKRDGPKVFVGEYAVTSGSGRGNLRGAIGEAAFMTGMERNSDVVIMASYAPLFVNVNHQRWPINLINFDSSRAFGLPSYYVQQMFSLHRGDVVLPAEVESPATSARPQGGAVGVGTWATRAEFKDIKVTRGNETLWTADFATGTQGWKLLGGGDWKAEAGALRQSSAQENIRAVAGDKSWTDYTYSLKARKLGGAEGFLILFRVRNEEEKSWWNIGGWGNKRHAVEMGGVVGNEVEGSIETGRWYDIRVELKGDSIKCYLDNQLVHDLKTPTMRALYASATRVRAGGEVIVKVVNAAAEPIDTQVKLSGVSRLNGPAQAIVLTSANPTDENTLEQPAKVSPQKKPVEANGPIFRHTFPGNSLTVLRLPAAP
jgi:alpha-L-arabinofuranosidase